KRLARLEADTAQELRHLLETGADFRHRPVLLLQHGQQLQGRHKAITGRGEIREDDVTRLLAADIKTLGAHRLEHIAVAHLGAFEREAKAAEIALKAKIAHDGGDNATALEHFALKPALGDHRHELV